jgi:hypothetical protein
MFVLLNADGEAVMSARDVTLLLALRRLTPLGDGRIALDCGDTYRYLTRAEVAQALFVESLDDPADEERDDA